jgi:GT2 family glycosyltransferase
MTKQATIAILITCHNRRETTLSCLAALYQQKNNFDVYLVDDGSSDGTADAVTQQYPQVKTLQGNGNLFWGGGMRLAFAEAMKNNYDYYLWLNDDTILESQTLSKLLKIHSELVQENKADSIVVGSTQDSISGKPTYGGAIKSKRWYSNKFEFLEPNQKLQECDTMYGNCILIPHSVAAKVGNIDPAFIHSLGDLDYGLRARQLGCSIWVAPGYVGTCSQNSVAGSWVDLDLSVIERLNKALQVKNFPILPWTTFAKRHSGFLWFIYWFLPYIRAVIGYKDLNTSPTFAEDTLINKQP